MLKIKRKLSIILAGRGQDGSGPLSTLAETIIIKQPAKAHGKAKLHG